MKLVVIEDVGEKNAKPLYDVTAGDTSLVASPKGPKAIKNKKNSILVPMYQLSPDLFRAIGDTMDEAEQDEAEQLDKVCSAILVVNSKTNKIGFLAV